MQMLCDIRTRLARLTGNGAVYEWADLIGDRGCPGSVTDYLETHPELHIPNFSVVNVVPK